MTQHLCREYDPMCWRCDLAHDELDGEYAPEPTDSGGADQRPDQPASPAQRP